MTKITLNNLTSLQNETSVVTAINNNNAVLQFASDNTLSRDGTAPNAMLAPLDMNSQQILNLPAPATPGSALRLQDLQTFIGGGTISQLPAGGNTNQILAKHSDADYDYQWANGGGTVNSVALSMPADFTVSGSPVTTTGTLSTGWATPPTGTGAVVRATSPTITTPTISSIVNTGTLTLPTSTDTLVGRATTDTLTNKTLTSPVIGTIVNTGTLTLPTTTDTIVGRATTDTLTNKTISGSSNTLSNIGNSSLTNSSITIGSTSVSLGGTLSAATGRGPNGLNIDQMTTQGDADTTIGSTVRTIATSATLTAARTWTLPAASALAAGQTLCIIDAVGGINGANTLTILRAGLDTIGGASSSVLSTQYASLFLVSDGSSRWTPVAAASGGGSGSVTNVSTGAGLTGGPVTTTGTISSILPITPQGRITLATGIPVMTTTQSAKTTVYYTPYVGQYVPLYDGTNMVPTDIGGELSQATTDTTKSPAAVTTNSNYDVFVWNDGGTIRATRGPAWSSSTVRGTGAGTTELTRVKGVWLNANAITNGPAANRGTYVGTIRSNGSSQIDFIFGSVAGGGGTATFNVWNCYNRILVETGVADSTTTWTYGTATFRQPNGTSGTMRINVLRGLDEDPVEASYHTLCTLASATSLVGVGLDSTTTPSSLTGYVANTSASVIGSSNRAFYRGLPGLGVHFFQALEWANASLSYYANGTTPHLTGLFARVIL